MRQRSQGTARTQRSSSDRQASLFESAFTTTATASHELCHQSHVVGQKRGRAGKEAPTGLVRRVKGRHTCYHAASMMDISDDILLHYIFPKLPHNCAVHQVCMQWRRLSHPSATQLPMRLAFVAPDWHMRVVESSKYLRGTQPNFDKHCEGNSSPVKTPTTMQQTPISTLGGSRQLGTGFAALEIFKGRSSVSLSEYTSDHSMSADATRISGLDGSGLDTSPGFEPNGSGTMATATVADSGTVAEGSSIHSCTAVVNEASPNQDHDHSEKLSVRRSARLISKKGAHRSGVGVTPISAAGHTHAGDGKDDDHLQAVASHKNGAIKSPLATSDEQDIDTNELSSVSKRLPLSAIAAKPSKRLSDGMEGDDCLHKSLWGSVDEPNKNFRQQPNDISTMTQPDPPESERPKNWYAVEQAEKQFLEDMRLHSSAVKSLIRSFDTLGKLLLHDPEKGITNSGCDPMQSVRYRLSQAALGLASQEAMAQNRNSSNDSSVNLLSQGGQSHSRYSIKHLEKWKNGPMYWVGLKQTQAQNLDPRFCKRVCPHPFQQLAIRVCMAPNTAASYQILLADLKETGVHCSELVHLLLLACQQYCLLRTRLVYRLRSLIRHYLNSTFCAKLPYVVHRPLRMNGGTMIPSAFVKVPAPYAPSREQRLIVETDYQPGDVILVSAFAGSGKTSTLRDFALSRPWMRMLYMCFNKAVQANAEKSMPSNVTCLTTHKIALIGLQKQNIEFLNASNRKTTERNAKSASKLTSRLSNHYLRSLLVDVSKERGIDTVPMDIQIGWYVRETLVNFCCSTDDGIKEIHLLAVVNKQKSRGAAPAKWTEKEASCFDFLTLVQAIWSKMVDPMDNAKLEHDFYLKYYTLTQPRLDEDYDVLLIDEAQDTNPPWMSMLMNQKACLRVYVGDPHQQIYQFRQAINAMHRNNFVEETGSVFEYSLTESFRFGSEIASLANEWLSRCKKEEKFIQSSLVGDRVGLVDRSKPYTVLCRTNRMIFETICQLSPNQKAFVVGGLEAFGLHDIMQLQTLYLQGSVQGDSDAEASSRVQDAAKNGVTHPLLKYFWLRWDSFVEFVEKTGDGEWFWKVELVKQHKQRTQDLVQMVHNLTRKCSSERDADVVLSTAHKAKGLEWNQVVLAEDFADMIETKRRANRRNDMLPDHSHNSGDAFGIQFKHAYKEFEHCDINTVYVAITRAKQRLEPCAGLSAIVDVRFLLPQPILEDVSPIESDIEEQESLVCKLCCNSVAAQGIQFVAQNRLVRPVVYRSILSQGKAPICISCCRTSFPDLFSVLHSAVGVQSSTTSTIPTT